MIRPHLQERQPPVALRYKTANLWDVRADHEDMEALRTWFAATSIGEVDGNYRFATNALYDLAIRQRNRAYIACAVLFILLVMAIASR